MVRNYPILELVSLFKFRHVYFVLFFIEFDIQIVCNEPLEAEKIVYPEKLTLRSTPLVGRFKGKCLEV